MPELCRCPVQWLQDNFYGGSATKRIVIKEPSLTTPPQKANRRKNKTHQPRLCPHMLCVASLYLLPHTQQYCTIRTRSRGRPRVSYATCFVCHVFRMPRVLYTTCFVHHVFRTPWAKTIKKNTNSTQNKSETHHAKQYEVTSFLSTDCELSTETCSKNVYSLGPMCFIHHVLSDNRQLWRFSKYKY